MKIPFSCRALLVGALLPLVAAPLLFATTNPYPNDNAHYQYRQYNGQMNYRLFVPPAYNPNDTTTKYPMVIWLHSNDRYSFELVVGDPTIGNDSQMIESGQFAFVSAKNQALFPCFFVMPQRGPAEKVAGGISPLIHGLIGQLAQEFPIDLDRVVVTGQSGGGGNTRSVVSAYPNDFCAFMPVCAVGGGDPAKMAKVPMWLFHAANDGTVGVSGSDSLYQAIQANGGKPIYTRHATGDHEQAWFDTYDTPTLIPWLAAQRRGKPQVNNSVNIAVLAPTVGTSYSPTVSTSFTISGAVTIANGNTELDPKITAVRYAAGTYNVPGANTAVTNVTTTTDPITGAPFLINWSSAVIPLNAENTVTSIKAVAVGTSFSPTYGGNTYYSTTLNATYKPTGDAMVPAVTVSSPVAASSFSINTTSVALGGTASDANDVTGVYWRNVTTGASGTATGTTSWSTGSIVLKSGANQIRVQGLDPSGNMGTANVAITSLVPPPALPTPTLVWTGLDIATPVTGTYSYNHLAGAYTVTGAGKSLWGTSDQFYYLYKTMNGDGSITARVSTITSSSAFATVGVMIRANLTAASPSAYASLYNGSTSIKCGYHANNDGWNNDTQISSLAKQAWWVRVTRSGNTFTWFTSPDGSTWTQRVTNAVTMPTQVYVGMYACGGDGAVGGTGTSKVTATIDNVSATGTTPTLLAAASRLVHGAAGTFDKPLPVIGSPTVESRQGAVTGQYQLVLTFDQPVAIGNAAVTTGIATAGTPTFAGNTMSVPLTSVANKQLVTVQVSGVSGAVGGLTTSASVSLNFLIADVNSDKTVNAADASTVKLKVGQAVAAGTYLYDINANGVIDAADAAIAKLKVGNSVP